mgnify:CR=1 FL=1
MTTCNIQNFTNVSGTTKNITFLAPNTLYSFKFTPVNSAGSLNTGGVSKLYSATLANITSLNSQNVAATSANIYWLSTASKLNISYGTQSFTLPFGRNSNYDIKNLNANTTYTVSLYPINQCNLIYNTPTQTTFTTLPTIGTAIYSSYTDTSVLISWNSASINMYSSVSILNGNATFAGITNSYYNLQYLLPNTTYNSIVIQCYNSQGVENTLLRQYLPPLTTLGTLNNYYINNILSSNITVNWGGSNSTVGIQTKQNNVTTFNQINIPGTSYVVTSGLQPNLDYNVSIIPYNSAGASNETYRQFQTITTLARAPYLSNTFKSDTQMQFYLTGGTYTCNVVNWLGQSIRFNTSNILISNLSPNTNYTFNTYPINSKDVINYTEYTSCNINTKSRVILSPITNTTDTKFTVNWLADSYDYLLINWNTSNSDKIYNGITYFNVSNLSPNTYYNINVTTYGIDGRGVTQNTSNFTLGNVATNFVLTSSNIILYNTGAYKYNNITLSDAYTNTFNCNLYSNVQYVSPPLISNRTYTVSVNPYNTCNIQNTPGTNILYLTTLATVGASSSTNVLSKTLTQNWQTGTYSFVSLSWNTSNIYNIYGNSVNVTNLTPNTNYTFTVTPYNSAGNPNTSEISQNNLLTLSYIDSVTYTNTTPNTSTANWYSANGYKSVVILYNITGSPNVIATSNIKYGDVPSYYLIGLSPNTSYTFTIIPYNANNVANTVEESITQIVTLGTINQVNYINKSQSNIDFNWSGIYSSVNIQWNSVATLSGVIVNSSLLINTNLLPILQPNTSYKIDVIPCNSNVIPGTSNSINATTFASLTQLSYTSNESSIYLVYNNTNTYAGGRIFFNDAFITNFIDNAYNFQNLTTGTTYKIQLIPYNTDIDLVNGGYSYTNYITTLGNYQFTTYNFVNNTTAGYNALSLSALLSLQQYNVSWASANITYYTNTRGYIQLTLPASGYYNITLAGAAGGCNTTVMNTNGFGAVLSSRFYVNIASEKLILVPGLMGTSTNNPAFGAGGGGATSLFRYNYSTGAISPLMVAGGGGGMSSTSAGNNCASGFVFETVSSTNVGNSVDQTAGCATQNYISTNTIFAQPTFSSGGTVYTATGANTNIPGGFGGGGAGTLDGTGGGGGSWTGSLNSVFSRGGYGGNRNMIISSGLNSTFNGYHTGNGYITITRTLYPILNVATTPITNISWGILTINWGSYDSSVNKILVSWIGDAATGFDSGNSGYLTSGSSYIVRNLIYSASQTYNYTFTITPFDKYNNAGTPLVGTSANASTGNLTSTNVTIPVTGQLSASATAITNLTNSSFTINWVSIPASSSITYCIVTWSGNTSAKITNSTRTYAITGLTANTQYTITVTPYNIYDIAGVPLLFTTTTLPLAFVAFTATPITNNSSNTFRINWNNGGATPYYNTLNLSVYSNVDSPVLVYNETGINNTTSSRTITNLVPNMLYFAYLNALAVDGLTYTTITTSNLTNAYIGYPINITNVSSSNYTLSWNAAGTPPSYSNVTLVVKNNYTFSNLFDTTFTVSGLLPYTTYSNLIYPVNSSNISTNYYITSNVTTLPGMITIYPSALTTTGMTLNWTGNYAKLNISGTGVTTLTNVSGNSTTYTGLNTNTGYTFTFTPFDNLNTVGVTSNVTFYTLPSIGTLGTCTAYTDNATIAWNGGIYSYINISWTGATNGVLTNVTTSPVNITGLTGNSTYTFTLTPYNPINYPGASLTTSLTTTSYLTNVSITPADTSAVVNYYGYYDYVTITRTGYTSGATTTMPFTMTGLTPSSTYTVTVTPTGIRGNGTAINTTVNTLGNITAFSYSSLSSNMIRLNWTGTYSFANLAWTGTSTSNFNVSSSTNTILLNGLSNTGTYSFSLTPYNTVSVAGTVNTLNAQLLPFVSLSSISDITSNTFTVNWNSNMDYTTYTGVNVSLSDGTNSGLISSNTSNYVFTNLPTNTAYTVQLTPYLNSLAGLPITTVTSTLSVVQFNTPAFTNNTGTTLDVNWINTNPLYTSIAVYWTYSGGSSNSVIFDQSVSSYTLYNLVGSKTYTVSLYPYTPINTIGYITSQTVITLPIISFATPTIINQTNQSFYVNLNNQGCTSYNVQWYDKTGRNNNVAYATSTALVYTLDANSGYTVTITPYSGTYATGTAGSSISVTGYTLPSIYTASVSSGGRNNTALTVSYTGNQSFVKVSWRVSGIGSYSTSGFTTGYNSSYTITSLTGLTTYDIYVTPYNIQYTAGASSSTFQAKTLANVSGIVITPSSTSIRIDWTANSEYTFIYVGIKYPQDSDVNINLSGKLYPPVNTYTFTQVYSNSTFISLTPSTSYTIKVYPYETNLVYGNTLIYNVSTTA